MSDNSINFPINLYDGESFLWDIRKDGSIGDGTNNAYDNGFITNFDYWDNYGSTNIYTEDNGREVVLAPKFLGDGYGGYIPISVSRKIYVSENEGFARFLEIVTNTSSQSWDWTVNVNLNTNLGSNSNTEVVKTSSGDNIFTVDDNWIITDDTYGTGSGNNEPTLLQVIAGSGGFRPYSVAATSGSDNIGVKYILKLAPGQTQIITHFAAQNSDVATALAKGDILTLLGMDALAGMTVEEKRQVINFNTGVNNILPPDLVVLSASVANTTIIADGNISATWTVANQGNGGLSANIPLSGQIYVSDDAILEPSDKNVSSWYENLQTPLAPNASYIFNNNFTLSGAKPGNRYLLFVAASDNYQGESNKSNNTLAIPIEVKAPDLTVTEAKVGNGEPLRAFSWGENIPVSWTVKNIGDVAAPAWSHYGIYSSSDDKFDPTDSYVRNDSIYTQIPLDAGASYTFNTIIGTPQELGNRYLLFVADSGNYQGETNENNNVYAVPFEIKAPDLKISQVQAPSTAIPGQKISVSWTVENAGNGAAPTDWYDYVWLSSNNTFESWQDTLLTTENIASRTPLNASSSYTINKDITIPTTAKGTQYLLFMADGYSGGYYSYPVQPETNEANNIYAVPIQIGAPDLTFASAPQVPDTAILGGIISVNWTVKNQGNIAALANWSDNIYISNDTKFDNTDTFLGSQTIDEQTPLAADGSYTINNKILSIPTTATGQRYLLFMTDTGNNQSESNESNNTLAVPINVKAPDLTISQAEAPSTGTWGETISVSWTVQNIGDVAASADWYDRVYISSDSIFDFTDK